MVRKVEAPEPPLLPPEQAWFLRENLKLRLLNARLALLTRDEAGYREDLRVGAGLDPALFRRPRQGLARPRWRS